MAGIIPIANAYGSGLSECKPVISGGIAPDAASLLDDFNAGNSWVSGTPTSNFHSVNLGTVVEEFSGGVIHRLHKTEISDWSSSFYLHPTQNNLNTVIPEWSEDSNILHYNLQDSANITEFNTGSENFEFTLTL